MKEKWPRPRGTKTREIAGLSNMRGMFCCYALSWPVLDLSSTELCR